MTTARLPRVPPVAVQGAALGAAGLAGLAAAVSPRAALGLLGAAVFAPLALVALPAAVVAWTPLTFIEATPALGRAGFLAILVLLAAWAGTLRTSARDLGALLDRHRVLAASLTLLVVWGALSILWAEDPDVARIMQPNVVVATAAFVLVVTTIRTARHVRWIMLAYVIGALIATAVALFGAGLSTEATALEIAEEGNRLSDVSGDPNMLAAGLLPAMFVAAGLIAVVRNPLARVGLALAVAGLGAALAATESRGALVAIAVAAPTAIVLARGHRPQLIALVLCVAAAGGAFFVANPESFERITSFDAGGNGRSDLWKVGWEMVKDEPLLGVGLDNYRVSSVHYVSDVGALRFVDVIVEEPHVTHNLYLQQIAETGVVGLMLLLSVLSACLAAAWRAARAFERAGVRDHTVLARALLVAMVGSLTTSVFVSNSIDKRLWILMALGPALLTVARTWRPEDRR